MDRRSFIKTTSSGAAASFLSPSIFSQAPARPNHPEEERPNIIFVFTDDQRWDALGCAGNPVIHTPNMDALAQAGTRFERAFVTTPICAASRASVLTGTYERTHEFTFRTPPLGRAYTDMSYPRQLREAGYRTGFVGKFGMQVEDGVEEELFDDYQQLFRNPYFKERAGGRHLTNIITDRAVDFLRSTPDSQPFCLSISYNAPHAEDRDPRQYHWPASCDDLYRNVVIPEPENGGQAFFENQPLYLQHSMNRTRWYWRYDTPEKYQRMVKGYYRMITGVDYALGRLQEQLARAELNENTIIILMGDNGYFLGERGFAGKWLMYEPSIRVPLIIYDPRRPASDQGRVLDDFALNVDVAPTVLDLAGLDIPEAMQGRSLLPLLEGQPTDWREDIFCEHLLDNDDIPQSEGIRTDRWKYLRYRNHMNSEELYDLKRDPHEEDNLAWRREYSEILLKLRSRCDEQITQLTRERL